MAENEHTDEFGEIDVKELLDVLQRMEGARLTMLATNVVADDEVAEVQAHEANMVKRVRQVVIHMAEEGEPPEYLQGELPKRHGKLTAVEDRIENLERELADEEDDDESRAGRRGVQ